MVHTRHTEGRRVEGRSPTSRNGRTAEAVATFSTVHPCPASPTGFVEIAEALVGDNLDVEAMTAAELLRHPHVRPLGAAMAADARAAWGEAEVGDGG